MQQVPRSLTCKEVKSSLSCLFLWGFRTAALGTWTYTTRSLSSRSHQKATSPHHLSNLQWQARQSRPEVLPSYKTWHWVHLLPPPPPPSYVVLVTQMDSLLRQKTHSNKECSLSLSLSLSVWHSPAYATVIAWIQTKHVYSNMFYLSSVQNNIHLYKTQSRYIDEKDVSI